jgi:hypothetical protein
MPKQGRFAYYNRLSAAEKRTYRASDEVASIRLPDASALTPLARELERVLATGQRATVARAASALAEALCRQLGVRAVRVRVRLVRPEIQGGELHGLYTFSSRGESPTIEVWMRTAAHRRVVRFRTFLRTLVHELVHHLDATLLELDDSFHTEGFFLRESSLVRQILSPPKPRKPGGGQARPVQLGLFTPS